MRGMSDCPSLPQCPFFNDMMPSRPAMASMMKQAYCKTDNGECARWVVAQARGKEAVPKDLYPSQMDRARQIVGAVLK
jgi:hypothetical protein